MAHDATKARQSFVLPVTVVGPADVRRLSRELEDVDEFLRQAAIRKGGTTATLPKTTRTLDSFADANALNFLQAIDRAKATAFLDDVMSDAPVIHISFAADPSAAFTAKIVTWLRQNIHERLLVQIGLQPTIAAGCIVRTESKVFDFSLRQYLVAKRDLLTQAIGTMGVAPASKPQAAAAPAQAASAGVAHD